MPFENEPSGMHISTLLSLESTGRRSIDSYERELAALRGELREVVARDESLLREKVDAIRRQEFLTQECHHRLLNNLQMIAGLLVLQGRTETNVEAAARLAVAADRVQSIARLHRHLHSMDGTQTVEFKAYLDELGRDHSMMSMAAGLSGRLIVVEAIELQLSTAIGIPLSLIVNELITNAIKHGEGSIIVKLEKQFRRALSVSNDGPVLPEGFDPTACKGLGIAIVSALAAQIGGKLRIDRGDNGDCTRFTVLFD